VIRENCLPRRSAPNLLSGAQAPRLINPGVPGVSLFITHCSQRRPALLNLPTNTEITANTVKGLIRECLSPVTCHP